MNVGHLTATACAICQPAGIDCRYEWDAGRKVFAWVFLHNGHRLKSISKPGAVITAAEKLVDNGK